MFWYIDLGDSKVNCSSFFQAFQKVCCHWNLICKKCASKNNQSSLWGALMAAQSTSSGSWSWKKYERPGLMQDGVTVLWQLLCWHSYLIVSFVLVVVFYIVVEPWISTGWDRRDQGGLRFVRRGRHAAHSSTGLATVHPILEPAKKSGKMKGCKNRHQRGPTSWAIFEPSWVGSSILSFWCIFIYTVFSCVFKVFHLRYMFVFFCRSKASPNVKRMDDVGGLPAVYSHMSLYVIICLSLTSIIFQWFSHCITAAKVVRHILNDLERFGAKPIDFKAFLDIMTAKMGERDTKEEAVGKHVKNGTLWRLTNLLENL